MTDAVTRRPGRRAGEDAVLLDGRIIGYIWTLSGPSGGLSVQASTPDTHWTEIFAGADEAIERLVKVHRARYTPTLSETELALKGAVDTLEDLGACAIAERAGPADPWLVWVRTPDGAEAARVELDADEAFPAELATYMLATLGWAPRPSAHFTPGRTSGWKPHPDIDHQQHRWTVPVMAWTAHTKE